jgi:cytoskeletal protein CcmA (bactofilin family)
MFGCSIFNDKSKDPIEDEGTCIGSGAIFKGKINGKEKVTICGQFDGEIDVLAEVVIEETGIAKGLLIANDATISGKFKGNTDICGDVRLCKNAHVNGHIKARALITDEGAYFEGHCELHQKQLMTSTRYVISK